MRRPVLYALVALVAVGLLVALQPTARSFASKAAGRVVSMAHDLIDPPQTVEDLHARLFDPATAVVIGPANADEASTIVIFVDYNCVHCRRQARVLDLMEAEGRMPRVILRHLPHSEESLALAQAMLAARKQDGAAALHRVLMAAERIGPPDLPALAAAAGLDPQKLRDDAAAPDVEALLDADLDMAWNLRIRSTPTMIAAGTLRRGVRSGDIEASLRP